MTLSLDAITDKWRDILSCAEDRTERTLAEEVLEDLEALRKVL